MNDLEMQFVDSENKISLRYGIHIIKSDAMIKIYDNDYIKMKNLFEILTYCSTNYCMSIKYSIIEYLGCGLTSDVFRVESKYNKQNYVAKCIFNNVKEISGKVIVNSFNFYAMTLGIIS